MSFLIPDDRQALIIVSSTDAKGNQAALENVVFASSDSAVAAVDANGLIIPGILGVAQITVTADALIGEGEAMLQGLLDVEVLAGQAVSISVGAQLI